jgi:hypothetical protein
MRTHVNPQTSQPEGRGQAVVAILRAEARSGSARSVPPVADPAETDAPITVALKPLMRERKLTFRSLAELTQHHDSTSRGVTYAHLCALTSGREYPSRRSLELIAASLGIQPRYFAEYRIAELRDQLNGREVGFHAAWQRYLELAS